MGSKGLPLKRDQVLAMLIEPVTKAERKGAKDSAKKEGWMTRDTMSRSSQRKPLS